MARSVAELPKGTRITDYISLGVISKTFPLEKIMEAAKITGKESQRQRDMPAHVVCYYVIALALYMQASYQEVLRCLLEGVQWLKGPEDFVKVTGKSGISQARKRLGYEPMQYLHDQLVKPIATKETRGAWYRGWRLVSIDGTTLDIADTKENEAYFNRPGASRGEAAYPQLRLVSLVENGTHVLFGSQIGSCRTGENALADKVVESLQSGFLCLADRGFFSFSLWNKAHGTGADLLWRMKKNAVLPVEKRLEDGSFLSRIYSNLKDQRNNRNGVIVRVIEYQLKGDPDAEEVYRLITTILDPELAPAKELAALYHERWEIETAFGELKTHLRGARIVLRSKMPELVLQESYGLLMAHFAIRGLMHEAALKEDVDPDCLSFIHAVRVVRRKLPMYVAFPP
ncbi:MAG: IS4 family transposase [Desulfosudaceae bacterium]